MCIEYLVRSMAALVVASSLDANGKNLGAETALAAMRRGFRLVVGGITTPRASARTAGQTAYVFSFWWLEGAHPDTLFYLLRCDGVPMPWRIPRYRLADAVGRRWPSLRAAGSSESVGRRRPTVASTDRWTIRVSRRLTSTPRVWAAHSSRPIQLI